MRRTLSAARANSRSRAGLRSAGATVVSVFIARTLHTQIPRAPMNPPVCPLQRVGSSLACVRVNLPSRALVRHQRLHLLHGADAPVGGLLHQLEPPEPLGGVVLRF